MPDGGGIEMAQKIREFDPDAKILFMSGYSDAALEVQARTNSPFIRKPFLPADLIRKINDVARDLRELPRAGASQNISPRASQSPIQWYLRARRPPSQFTELQPGGTRTGIKESFSQPMTATTGPQLGQIHALLAERGYEVSETAPDSLKIREVDSGVAIQAVLAGRYPVLFAGLHGRAARRRHRRRDGADARRRQRHLHVATSSSTKLADGKVAVTLNNFCKLQDMGADDEDDILSCVHFLLVDVMSARRLVGDLES